MEVLRFNEPLAQACGFVAQQFRGLAPRGWFEATNAGHKPISTPGGAGEA